MADGNDRWHRVPRAARTTQRGNKLETGRRFDPTKYLRTIKTRSGKQETYLPVPARLLWLRSDHPNASVLTEALKLDDRNAIFKATITLPGGAVAVGHGSEAAGDFGDYIEKAETKAIGRALAALGYGMEPAEISDDSTIAATSTTSATDVLPVVLPALAPTPAPIAVVVPSTTGAAAPVTAPVSAPQPMQPPPLSSLAPLQEATINRPERGERYERPEPRIERNDRNDRNDRNNRTERSDRPERNDRNDRPEPRIERDDRPERTERADRYAPPPRSLMDRVPRPERPERAEPIEELSPPLPRPGMMERPVRPERVSRSRDLMSSSSSTSSAAPEPIEEMPPAPTPIRRTGRTLVARATGVPGASPLPALPALPANVPSRLPEPTRMMSAPEPEDTGDAGEADDELEPATISTTSFWRWAKSKGYPDRRAVEAATGRGMDTMTPREAYFRLREVIARGTTP